MIEYHLLKEIESNPRSTQRTLAEKLGVSLGKINYIIGGLIEKGVIKAKKLRNEPDSIRWEYLLTPHGLQEKIRLARAYLIRRKEEYSALQHEIALLEHEVDATMQAGGDVVNR